MDMGGQAEAWGGAQGDTRMLIFWTRLTHREESLGVVSSENWSNLCSFQWEDVFNVVAPSSSPAIVGALLLRLLPFPLLTIFTTLDNLFQLGLPDVLINSLLTLIVHC